MKDLISLIEAGNYEFKEPWRATNKSLSIIVPIVSKAPGTRKYVVLEEVKDKVDIKDTGGIEEARVNGNVDTPVFIRGGTMLKGETQERATQYGVVVMPQKSETVPVHCIHASKGIRPGASFFAIGHAPQQVYSSMLAARNQTVTWHAVTKYNLSLRASPAMAMPDIASDDLVKHVETIQKFRRDLKEILKSVPDYINQVGVVIIDPDGVVGLEMYDHPDSWKAFSESIIRSFSEVLTKEDKLGIFKPNMEAVIPVIQEFLKTIEKAQEEVVFNKHYARTVILKTKEFVGEYTTLNGKTIHFLITRHKETHIEPRLRRRLRRREPRLYPSRRERVIPALSMFYTTTGTETPRRLKKNFELINTLKEPKTWTSLTRETSMSKATLSNRLKQLQDLGFVDKIKFENGVTRYTLTGIGQELVKKKTEFLTT